MEPVASTYSSTSLTGYSAGYSGRTGTGSTAGATTAANGSSDAAAPRINEVTPDHYGEQKGIRVSGTPAEEFRPYSRPVSLKADGSTATDKGVTADSAGNNKGASATAADTTIVPGKKESASNDQDPQVQAAVARLKSIEVKVKAHEAAHKAVGGAMTGPVSYSYTRGPDGRNYITGGEVPISITSGSTPQETINRMQQVIQAALAPADPSPQDRAVAAQAAAAQQQARQQQTETSSPSVKTDTAPGKPDGGTAAPETMTDPLLSDEDKQQTGQYGPLSLIVKETAGDSRRAYTDPAVTGRIVDSQDGIAPRQNPQTAAAATTGTQAAQSSITTEQITGFGSSRPLSYYA